MDKITLDSVRKSAVGGSLSEEELNCFHCGHEEERMIPTRYGETHVYIYVPEGGKDTYPLMLNLHGGGFVKGHRDQDVVYCRNMAQNAGYVVVDIDYHTAPEYKYPYALEESYDVLKYVVQHSSEFWADPDCVVVGGHSAGGNLAAGIQFLAQREDEVQISLLILDYPPVDFTNLPEERRYAYAPFIRNSVEQEYRYREWYLSEPDDMYKITVSPVLACKADLEKFPPVVYIIAEKDILSEESIRFATRLIDAGVTVYAKRIKGSSHGFTVRRTGNFEVAEQMILDALKHLKEQKTCR